MIRATTEIGPDLPEQLIFSTGEAELGVRAVSYRMLSKWHSVPQYHSDEKEALQCLTEPLTETSKEVDDIAQFVHLHHDLAGRFMQVAAQPGDPIELSPPELQAVGYALQVLGTVGLWRAQRAFKNDKHFASEAVRAVAARRMQHNVDDVYELYKEIEHIVASKTNIHPLHWKGPGPDWQSQLLS